MAPPTPPPRCRTITADPPATEEERSHLRKLDLELYNIILTCVRYDCRDASETEPYLEYMARELYWAACYNPLNIPQGAYITLEEEPSDTDRANKYGRNDTEPWWFPGLDKIKNNRLRYPLPWKAAKKSQSQTSLDTGLAVKELVRNPITYVPFAGQISSMAPKGMERESERLLETIQSTEPRRVPRANIINLANIIREAEYAMLLEDNLNFAANFGLQDKSEDLPLGVVVGTFMAYTYTQDVTTARMKLDKHIKSRIAGSWSCLFQMFHNSEPSHLSGENDSCGT